MNSVRGLLKARPQRKALAIAAIIGILAGSLCYLARGHPALYPGPGDFNWALNSAQSLLAGQDPYDFEPDAVRIPYPIPVVVFGLPWLWLPPRLAAAVHFGLGAVLLAYGILAKGRPWRLLIFLSFPFVYALLFAQWSPLITATWYFPVLAPTMVLVKPQTALPVALNRLTKTGVLLPGGVLLISLLLYPTWPWRWVAMLGEFESMIPLLAPTGIGLLLLLALLRWRSPRARLLLSMSILPFRGAYDLVPLYLVPNTAFGISILVLLSWIPVFISPFGAMAVKPAWAIAFLFFPALVLTLVKK